MNFGHTFAHAYEGTLNFSKKLNHGEAVILGMQTALKFSMMNNLLKPKEYKLIKNHIINTTEKAFDDFAGSGADHEANKKMLGIN